MRHFLIAATLVAIATPSARAQATNTDELKAAVVFNLLRFIEFPDAAHNQSVRVCVDRRSPSARAMATLNGRAIGARPITLRLVEPAVERSCDVIVTGQADASEIARLGQGGALVIGEGAGFTAAGGAIGLVKNGPQIRFEVNLHASRMAGVTISSRLLRLAARVRQ